MVYLNNVLVGTLILMVEIINVIESCKIHSDEEALYLTPYIEQGDIAGGQKASLTESLLHADTTVSYSGYFTVNNTYNSNMFFWFFPAEQNNTNVPLIVWLHGGPGLTSIFGLFELGVYKLDKGKLSKRDLYWSQKYNMLYLDNPIGAGFSFTEKDEGYSRTETDIGNNLYNALKQFYQLFPEYKKNDLYIAGTSYAGKFVPALANTIDINQIDSNKINLKGMMIGNGLSDPITIIMNRQEFYYQVGIIGINFKAELDDYMQELVNWHNQGKYGDMQDAYFNLLEPIEQNIGDLDRYHLLREDDIMSWIRIIKTFINNASIKHQIHVGNRSFKSFNAEIRTYLRNEFFLSVKPWVEHLLEKYKLLMYSGQLDLTCPYVLNSEYLHSLNWSGAELFQNAERKLWYLGNQLAGYTQTGGGLSEVLVRNAGHEAHVDKPKEVFDMINRFINYYID